MATGPKSFDFRAKLYKVWIMRCIDVPPGVSKALGARKHIPVRGWIEDLAFRSHLAPAGNGRHRLVVHSRIWRPLELDAGNRVTVHMELDEAPERFAMPEELTAAFGEDPAARAAYGQLTVAKRREIAGHVAAVKSAAAREKRIARLLDWLRRKKSSKY
jgi:hypothetical protein